MKKIPIIITISIVFLLMIAIVAMRFNPALSAVAGVDDKWYGYGGAMQCGYFYSSKLYDYVDFAEFCEGVGYECFLDNYLSTVDGQTIYEVYCQEYCYSCEDGEEYIWAAAPNCEGDELTDMPEEDVATYFDNPNAYNPGGSKDFGYCEDSTVTCFQCHDGDISSYEEKSGDCLSGWTEDVRSLNCQTSQDITCYKCIDGQIQSKIFDDVCSDGYIASQPPCQQDVTCYTCEGTSLRSQTFPGDCNLPYQIARPGCGTGNLISCDTCKDGVLYGGDFEGTCPAGYEESRTPPRSCGPLSGGWLKEIFDFENSPGQSIALVALIVVFFGLMIQAIRPKQQSVVSL